MSDVQFIDRLIAIPISAIDWWNHLFHRCRGSPDGRHLSVVRDGDYVCKYCGNPLNRIGPDTRGVDR